MSLQDAPLMLFFKLIKLIKDIDMPADKFKKIL